MRSFLQTAAGLVYLLATGAIAVLIGTAFARGARSLPEIERAVAAQLGSSGIGTDLMVYALRFAVWTIVSWPAFRLLGASQSGGWTRQSADRLDQIAALVRAQSGTNKEVVALLKQIRD